jgi:hypothetical protein
MLPCSLVSENKPVINSGDIVAIIHANKPPRREESNEPSRITRKNPIAVFVMEVIMW